MGRRKLDLLPSVPLCLTNESWAKLGRSEGDGARKRNLFFQLNPMRTLSLEQSGFLLIRYWCLCHNVETQSVYKDKNKAWHKDQRLSMSTLPSMHLGVGILLCISQSNSFICLSLHCLPQHASPPHPKKVTGAISL